MVAVGACRITMGIRMTGTKPNKHAQRTQATQQQLLQAAETIFVRDGYEGAELGEIAALAGRTKGAIYAHFKSKQDIFLALIRDRALQVRERTLQLMAATSSTHENREVYRKLCLSQTEDTTWAMLLLEFKLFAMRHPESKQYLERHYAEMLPEGQEQRLADFLGPAGLGKDTLTRSAAVQILTPLLSTLAIEATFAPRLLAAETRRNVAQRIFDALLPE